MEQHRSEAFVACQITFYHNYPRKGCNNQIEIELERYITNT